MRSKDYIGKRCGNWLIVSAIPITERRDNRKWAAKCVCGRTGRLSSGQIKAKRSLSCKWCAIKPSLRLRPYEALFNNTRLHAGDEHIGFSLTYGQFLRLAHNPICHYCTAALHFSEYCLGVNGSRSNLDRKNNSLGYKASNVVPCCKRCNFAKGNRFSYEEWFAMTDPFRAGLLPSEGPAKDLFSH